MVSDATGATDYANHLAALHMITMQGGVFGAHAESVAVIAALRAVADRRLDAVEAASA